MSSESIVARYDIDSNPSNPPSNPFAVPPNAVVANGTPVNLTTGAGGNCNSNNGALTCTLSNIALAIGIIDLYILDFDGQNGTGDLIYGSVSTLQFNVNGTFSAPGTTAPPITPNPLQANSAITPSPSSSPSPSPAPTSPQNALVYVSNTEQGYQTTSGSIVAFPLSTGGDVPPAKTISGSQTQLVAPYALAFDSSGNLYVANLDTPDNTGFYITIYSPGSNGNVAPIRIIRGTNTGLRNMTALAVDTSGYLYVSEDTSSEVCTSTSSSSCTANTYDTIAVFAANANGNVAPVRTISSRSCYAIGGIAILPSNELAAACMPPSYPAAPYTIGRRSYAEYAARSKDASQNNAEIVIFSSNASGNATPISSISGQNTGLSWAGPLAYSPLGVLWVVPRSPSEQDPAILGFPQNSSGNVTPTTDITGSSTQLNAVNLAVDSNGTVYALNSNDAGGGLTITEYSGNANGNASPEFVVTGPNNGLDCPSSSTSICLGGIAIGPP